MTAFLTNRWVLLAFRLFLALTFLYACIHKIAAPAEFAKIVQNYHILPATLVNLMALWLPWIELLAGLALVTGLWVRGGAGLVAGMLFMFMVAISVNLIRGLEFNCGCFSSAKGPSNPLFAFLDVVLGGQIHKPGLLLLRDAIILVPALVLLCVEDLRFRRRAGE